MCEKPAMIQRICLGVNFDTFFEAKVEIENVKINWNMSVAKLIFHLF